MHEPIEPLDPKTWFRRMARLQGIAGGLNGQTPEAEIRQAYHLVSLAPPALRDLLPDQLEDGSLEKLLECGAYETAVLELIGENIAFTARKDAGSRMIKVTMLLDRDEVKGSGEHHSCSIAMLKAWSNCFVNFGKMADTLNRLDRDRRRSPDGPPPRSTEH